MVAKRIKRDIDQELMNQKNEIDDINYKITRLTETILDRYPKHFGIRNIIDSLFAALLVGLTFILKGATVPVALNMKLIHVIAILIFTFFIVLLQIYFVSYSRVRSREERPLIPFITKRMLSIVLVSFFVSFLLIYLLGINQQIEDFDGIMRVTFLVSAICAIGSAIPGLMIKY